jgi:hypothetical protein
MPTKFPWAFAGVVCGVGSICAVAISHEIVASTPFVALFLAGGVLAELMKGG